MQSPLIMQSTLIMTRDVTGSYPSPYVTDVLMINGSCMITAESERITAESERITPESERITPESPHVQTSLSRCRAVDVTEWSEGRDTGDDAGRQGRGGGAQP